MLKIPEKKIFNSYIIETEKFDNSIVAIEDFAIKLGFEKVLINSKSHPDVIYIESLLKPFEIDNIREKIVNTVDTLPMLSNKKIYIIYNASLLTNRIQNSLLKTLEDSPIYNIFFLLTKNANNLLSTIKSRCILLKDEDYNIDIDYYYNLEYCNDAVLMLTNINHYNISDIISFSNRINDSDIRLIDLTNIFRIISLDSIIYKNTLDTSFIKFKKFEEHIKTFASSNEINNYVIGNLLDRLEETVTIAFSNINKSLLISELLIDINKIIKE